MTLNRTSFFVDQDTLGLRLSPQQAYLWAASQAGCPATARATVQLEGDLDAGRLGRALRAVVQRHEILRTRFSGSPAPYQVIGSEASVEFTLEPKEPGTHVLTLTAPVLCADPGTLQLLIGELLREYAGEGSVPSAQFADFSERLNEIAAVEDEAHDGANEFLRLLDFGSLPVPRLPLEKRLAKPEPGSVAHVDLALDRAFATEAGNAATRIGVSISDLACAAWVALLVRLTGEPELPVVRFSDGRENAQSGAALGPRSTPLPVRVRSTDDMSFTEFARQIGKLTADAERWRDRIAPEAVLGPADHPAGSLAFTFVPGLPDKRPENLRAKVQELDAASYPAKIQLTCLWSPDGPSARIHYRPELMEKAEIERFARYFERLWRQCVQNPLTPVRDHELMDDAERLEVTAGFNETAENLGPAACFHKLFEQQAERVPDRVALTSGDRQFTFRELNGTANQLAHRLRAAGVTANSCVGLFMKRSADVIVGLLGILKAGGAYVPLHAELPKPRLAHHLKDVQAVAVVTQSDLLDRLPEFAGAVIAIDRDRNGLAQEPSGNLGDIAKPEDLIYVIFTSGSTGVPKGVATRHENVVNYTRSICRQLRLDGNSDGLSFANVSTLGADLGNTGIFASLASGGTLHMMTEEEVTDGQAYAARATRAPVDVIKVAPSHLRALLSSGDPAKVLPRKWLITGGERLTWDLVRQVRALGTCEILNHYGPTETTVGALTFPVNGGEWTEEIASGVPLGRPLANTVIYILDANQRPVPVGVAGELYIGGQGVANGYLKRPELTAERFLKDPVQKDSGRTFFRTGDGARWLPGGIVEFLGRGDDQVKIRGFRVELGEIEAMLTRHPEIEQACVLLRDSGDGDQMLVACFRAPARPAEAGLRAFLAERVPNYMLPTHFVRVESFPLSPNGKADRRALAALVETAQTSAVPVAAEMDPTTEGVLTIWREVLAKKDIELDDNLFKIGGHSLKAILIVSRVRAKFQVQIPVSSIFEQPTVRGLSGIVQAAVQKQADEELEKLINQVAGLSDEDVQRLMDETPGRS